jgi:SAM-dependent methyltransferase
MKNIILEKITFLYRVFYLAKTWGFIKILIFIPFEIYYGLKLRTKTLFSLNNKELDIKESIKENSTEYFPTPYYVMHEISKKIKEDLKDAVFIDFGSGAGRVLSFILKFKPKKIIGIELSKKLCQISNDNLENQIKKSKDIITKWEIININATNYEIPLESNIFFFYDPFNDVVLDQIVKKIITSYIKNKRSIIVIYVSPRHLKIFIKRKFKVLNTKINKYGKGYAIFKYG